MTRPANTEIREKIIDAAEKIVVENGHETLNMRDTAAVLGITATTIYRYFTSREDLLLEIRLRAAGRLNERIERIGPDLPPGEFLLRLGREYVAFAEDNPRLYVLMFEEVSGELNPEEADRRILYRTYAAARDALERIQTDSAKRDGGAGNDANGHGNAADPAQEALLGWIMLHGFSSLLISGRLHIAEGMSTETLKEMFFAYFTHEKHTSEGK